MTQEYFEYLDWDYPHRDGVGYILKILIPASCSYGEADRIGQTLVAIANALKENDSLPS